MIKILISNMNLIIKRILGVLLLAIVASACQSIVPATSPLQLSHTPSPPITITDSQIDADWFRLDYPDNWRVITHIASEPLHLILVSPDDMLIIHIEDARNGCNDEGIASDNAYLRWDDCIGEGDAQVHIWGEQEISLQNRYEPFFDFIRASVMFR